MRTMKFLYIFRVVLLTICGYSVSIAQTQNVPHFENGCDYCVWEMHQNADITVNNYIYDIGQITPYFGPNSDSYVMGSSNTTMSIYQLGTWLIGILESAPKGAINVSINLLYATELYWNQLNEVHTTFNSKLNAVDQEFCYCLSNYNCANGCGTM